MLLPPVKHSVIVKAYFGKQSAAYGILATCLCKADSLCLPWLKVLFDRPKELMRRFHSRPRVKSGSQISPVRLPVAAARCQDRNAPGEGQKHPQLDEWD